MKTIFKSYKLQTNGKILTVSLTALFRAVGMGGDVASGEVPADVLDRLHVLIERPGVTGLTELQRGNNTVGYVVDGEKLTIFVTNLPVGISRVFVYTQYGTNAPAALVADLDVPQNVAFLNVAGSYTPLIRAAEKDETVDGAKRYAYVYPHGDTVVWFETETLDLVHEVTVYVASGINSEFADATEKRGRVERNVMAGTYDESEDVTVAPVDTFGGIGGGGGESNLLIGTQEEREALVDPREGLEFNEVHQDPDTGVFHVERYIRENGAWVMLESPQTETVETVTLHVSTIDGARTTEGLAVGITDRNLGVAISRVLNAAGECTFDIPKGHRYVVSVAHLDGYHLLPDEEFIATMDERTIQLVFQLETTEYETVLCHLTVYNEKLQDVTAQDTDLIGRDIVCEIENHEPIVAQVDDNHVATFHVPYGYRYTIKEPLFHGFMTRYKTTFTYTASIPQRTIPMHYVRWVNVGVYGITEAGVYYTYNQMIVLSDEEKAQIKYIALNTSRLQAANAAFFYKVPRVSQSIQWVTNNVEFDQSLLPFKQNHAAAVLDMDGQTNTQNIIAIGESMGVATPAATYCAGETALLQGDTHQGFLGSYGQMYALAENITELNAIHSILGVATPGFTAGYWWSSTQYNATHAVALLHGGFYNHGKNYANPTVALFAF